MTESDIPPGPPGPSSDAALPEELPAGVLPEGMTVRDIGAISTPGEGEPSAEKSMGHWLFFNDLGLRAGWRFAIFLLIVAALNAVQFLVISRLRHGQSSPPLTTLTAQFLLLFDGIAFAIILLASWIMSRIEGRKLGAYGLPLRRGALRNFSVGVLWGFGALTVLLAAFWISGNYHPGHTELHGAQLLYYPVAWGFAFLLVGLSEEFTFRGYGQFTLTTGMGFWPSAILFSLLFGWVHHTNSGEQFMGLAQVVIIALFFCFTLYRTGTLWFAVGYHAAWDWGQTFFYGTPDSGLLGRGHFLNPRFSGPAWLTGGSVGPEGSYLNVPLVLLVTLLFALAYRERKPYPDPSAMNMKMKHSARP